MAYFKNCTGTKPVQLYIVRRDSTKFMLTVPDTRTSWEITYLQVFCQNWCLMFDLLLSVYIVGNILFVLLYIFDIFAVSSDNYHGILRMSFLLYIRQSMIVFFLCQQTYVSATITASSYFENRFRTCSKIIHTIMSISIFKISIFQNNKILKRWN